METENLSSKSRDFSQTNLALLWREKQNLKFAHWPAHSFLLSLEFQFLRLLSITEIVFSESILCRLLCVRWTDGGAIFLRLVAQRGDK